MISRTAPYLDPSHPIGGLVLPLLRQFWMIVLIVTIGALSSLAYARMQVPQYEATAVVQTLPGVDVAAAKARVTSRENLLAMVTRHGLDQGDGAARSAVRLRQSIAVRDLTSDAGSTLGFDGEVSGIVASVLWSDADQSARLANDLAQQILDAGNQGQLTENFTEMAFFRRDEQRLWQEIGAMATELEAAKQGGGLGIAQRLVVDGHRLALMQDQYELVRERLARFEVDARLAKALQAGQFSLLQRAKSTDAVTVVHNWMLVGVAGSLLLAVALAFVLERRYPSLQRGPWEDFAVANQRLAHFYRVFDDPTRPILGLPRFMVVSGVVVAWLVAIAVMLR